MPQLPNCTTFSVKLRFLPVFRRIGGLEAKPSEGEIHYMRRGQVIGFHLVNYVEMSYTCQCSWSVISDRVSFVVFQNSAQEFWFIGKMRCSHRCTTLDRLSSGGKVECKTIKTRIMKMMMMMKTKPKVDDEDERWKMRDERCTWWRWCTS